MKNSMFSFLLAVALSTPAFSSGITLHIWMAEKAIDLVQHEDLKKLALDEKDALLNGAIYPDSGYTFDDGYGEISHWGSFQNAYIKYIKEHCAYPFTGSCRPLVAHFLGAFSHGKSDVNFDRHFVEEAARRTFGGSFSEAQKYIDPGIDFIAILEHKRGRVIPKNYVPFEALASIYQDMGEPYTVEHIKKGTSILRAALIGERLAAPFTYLFYKLKLPWASENYLRAKGGVLDSARNIAHNWNEIWPKLLPNSLAE